MRSATLLTLSAVAVLQGCATAPRSSETPATEAAAPTVIYSHTTFAAPNFSRVANATEIPVEKDAPPAEGHPLTSVVVTQCNLIVAVYVTMPDGRLLRFDGTANVPADQLLGMAYTATRSERVEVACDHNGIEGYETHNPL